jgi:hypothetical protein
LREKRDVAESEIKRVVVLPTNGRRRQAKPSTRKKGNYCFLGCFPNFIFEKKKYQIKKKYLIELKKKKYMKSKRIRKGRVFTHVISATRTTSCQLFNKNRETMTQKN